MSSSSSFWSALGAATVRAADGLSKGPLALVGNAPVLDGAAVETEAGEAFEVSAATDEGAESVFVIAAAMAAPICASRGLVRVPAGLSRFKPPKVCARTAETALANSAGVREEPESRLMACAVSV